MKSPDFVPVVPQVAFSGMGQARIENNLLYYLFYCIHYLELILFFKRHTIPKLTGQVQTTKGVAKKS